MAAEMGVSEATVRRIWHAHGLKPHLVETFKVSKDKQFAEKLEAIVGLYRNPRNMLLFCVKKPDPGVGSHSAGPTDQERPV